MFFSFSIIFLSADTILQGANAYPSPPSLFSLSSSSSLVVPHNIPFSAYKWCTLLVHCIYCLIAFIQYISSSHLLVNYVNLSCLLGKMDLFISMYFLLSSNIFLTNFQFQYILNINTCLIHASSEQFTTMRNIWIIEWWPNNCFELWQPPLP